jgi:hypothetical protein
MHLISSRPAFLDQTTDATLLKLRSAQTSACTTSGLS